MKTIYLTKVKKVIIHQSITSSFIKQSMQLKVLHISATIPEASFNLTNAEILRKKN